MVESSLKVACVGAGLLAGFSYWVFCGLCWLVCGRGDGLPGIVACGGACDCVGACNASVRLGVLVG